MKTRLMSLLLALLLAGCATYRPPGEYKIEKGRIISQTFGATRDRVIERFAPNGTPMKTVEEECG